MGPSAGPIPQVDDCRTRALGLARAPTHIARTPSISSSRHPPRVLASGDNGRRHAPHTSLGGSTARASRSPRSPRRISTVNPAAVRRPRTRGDGLQIGFARVARRREGVGDMASMTCSKRFTRVALVVLGIAEEPRRPGRQDGSGRPVSVGIPPSPACCSSGAPRRRRG